jgi:hypothetical protein
MNLLKIVKNRNEILEGIKNNLIKKEHVEEIYSDREAICKACPQYDLEGDKCELKGSQPCCGNCGCSLKFKLRSLTSECPEGKWDAVVDDFDDEQLIKENAQ